MKKLSLFSLLLAHSAFASLTCDYRDKWFLVTHQEVQYKQSVFPSYWSFSLACGEKLAGMYDGDLLTVFDAEGKRFDSKNVGNVFDPSQMAVGERVLALYEGERFWVYSGGRFESASAAKGFRNSKVEAGGELAALYDGRSFQVFGGRYRAEQVRERYQHARLSVGPHVAVLYDGDDLWVYDRSEEDFSRHGAKGDYLFTRVFSSGEGMLAYDGETLIGYCAGGKWAARAVAKDAFSQAKADVSSGNPLMQIDKTWYRLETGPCAIEDSSR